MARILSGAKGVNRVLAMTLAVLTMVGIMAVAAPSITAEAASLGAVQVTGTNVNVRKGAGTSYAKVTSVSKPNTYEYTATKSSGGYTWYQIQVSSSTSGWIRGDYTTKYAYNGQQGTVTGSTVNIRSNAGTSYSVTTTVSKGTKLNVIDSKKDSSSKVWYRVYVPAAKRVGYIRYDYLSIASAAPAVKSGDSLFSSSYKGAVFYSPHQDDELLYYNQAILNAIKAYGQSNVYVVLVTDGGGSGLLNNTTVQSQLNTMLKNAGLSQTAANRKDLFVGVRNSEFYRSCTAMGVKASNITFWNYADGSGTSNFTTFKNNVESKMESFAASHSGYMHFAVSSSYDKHKDHNAIGQALRDSSLGSGAGKYYVVDDIYDTSYVSAIQKDAKLQTYKLTKSNSTDKTKIVNAMNCYKASTAVYNTTTITNAVKKSVSTHGTSVGLRNIYTQPDIINNLRLGIGNRSVGSSFTTFNNELNSSTGNVVWFYEVR